MGTLKFNPKFLTTTFVAAVFTIANWALNLDIPAEVQGAVYIVLAGLMFAFGQVWNEEPKGDPKDISGE